MHVISFQLSARLVLPSKRKRSQLLASIISYMAKRRYGQLNQWTSLALTELCPLVNIAWLSQYFDHQAICDVAMHALVEPIFMQSMH
jgi:hypothetical protein